MTIHHRLASYTKCQWEKNKGDYIIYSDETIKTLSKEEILERSPKEIYSSYKEKHETVLNWICVKFNSKERF
jgi:hypothetical protein